MFNLRILFIILAVVLGINVASALSKPILAQVVFENYSNQNAISGVFVIFETNQRFKISQANPFVIELPCYGQYHFTFETNDFIAYTSYPVKITKSKNMITIRLHENSAVSINDVNLDFLNNFDSKIDDEYMKQGILEGKINFILHGMREVPVEQFEEFKNQYGVGFVAENCVLEPITYKKTVAFNKFLANYLTKKFGEIWMHYLPLKPLGISVKQYF